MMIVLQLVLYCLLYFLPVKMIAKLICTLLAVRNNRSVLCNKSNSYIFINMI